MAGKTRTPTDSARPTKLVEVDVKDEEYSPQPILSPARERKSIDDPAIDLGEIPNIQLLKENGEVNEINQHLMPDLPDAELRRVYRAMVLTRKLDERMLAMQRQGEMGTFAPGIGQEATQIGQVYPLKTKDWFSPSYRSFGAQIWRGWPIDHLLMLWDGFHEGFPPPEGVNDMPFSIVIGSHPPVATGIAMGIRTRGEDAVVVTNFGDGAFSQGAVAEAFTFAAVYQAPIVFVVENNGYAISMPVTKQTVTDHLAGRGPGFGIPGMRIDGNDILAMIWACTEAVNRARRGEGPTLIEAVTYRMSLHTTADDPKVYRSEDEVEEWRSRCPIVRFENYLRARDLLTDADIERTATECEQEVIEAREKFRKHAIPKPREIFDHLYDELPPELIEQREEYLRKLDRKGVK
jgi:pyruvate dehydrogenase E1 component alpha subunit